MVPEGRRPPPPGRSHGVSERSPNRLPVHDRVPAETKRDRTTRLPKISSAGWSFNRSAEPPSLAALRPWSTAPGNRISWGVDLGEQPQKRPADGAFMLYGADGPTVHVHPEFAVGTRRNYWSCRLSRTSMVVVLGTGWSGVTRGGIANGVAVVPEVPGLAPRGFYGARGGVGRAISPALQASERQDAEASLHGVSAGQDARSERPARWHGQPRPTRRRCIKCSLAGLASEREAGC